MSKPYYKKGTYNAVCDICGFEYKADEMRKNWKGLYVCKKDFETRHPQDYLRARIERIDVPWSRPEAEDIFRPVCYIWSSSGYSGLGVAGCMIAGQDTLTGAFLKAQRDEGSI